MQDDEHPTENGKKFELDAKTKAWLEAIERETRITHAPFSSISVTIDLNGKPSEHRYIMTLNAGKPSATTLNLEQEQAELLIPILYFEAQVAVRNKFGKAPGASGDPLMRCPTCSRGPARVRSSLPNVPLRRTSWWRLGPRWLRLRSPHLQHHSRIVLECRPGSLIF